MIELGEIPDTLIKFPKHIFVPFSKNYISQFVIIKLDYNLGIRIIIFLISKIFLCGSELVAMQIKVLTKNKINKDFIFLQYLVNPFLNEY